MNMLRLVETVNTTTRGVRFPIQKTVQFADDSAAAILVTSLRDAGVRSARSERNVVVQFSNVDDVNVFAGIYFPLLFAANRANAKLKDSLVPRTFKDRLLGVYPAPNSISVEASILAIAQRLRDVGVDVENINQGRIPVDS